jgi:hypothetical protein
VDLQIWDLYLQQAGHTLVCRCATAASVALEHVHAHENYLEEYA